MFKPANSTERFDFTLFNETGEQVTIVTEKPVDLLYYWASNVVVGTIDGKVVGSVYRKFKRNNFYPIRLLLDGMYYCGWIDEQYIK